MHIPVLVKETIEMLDVKANGTYVDATVGLGGHAAAVLSMLGTGGRLIGIDRDEDALGYASERLGNDRVCLRKGSFSDMEEILSDLNMREVDGVLFDLGVSMLQLKEYRRGFSFLSDERLDMRMDPSQRLTAWDIVNRYPEKDLGRILKEYGEEPFARRIAKAIVIHRRKTSIDTCAELANFVAGVYGRRGKTHPATKTFQALRIEVNKELDELKKGLASALNLLGAGGRMSVISYHSLEDRIVKNFMRDRAREGLLRILTKKPVVPAPDEIRQNPSSRSAKLRGAEKI
ncbi:MAG: 16S rRNA (cytosine(1402)-N(4))-methyltransferase RsmH [Nitrospirae bacterium]|nr:16S rRNA (cytosine(1402)-N(4))-methyltransferase RsmH [Nitrospirota bacterium]